MRLSLLLSFTADGWGVIRGRELQLINSADTDAADSTAKPFESGDDGKFMAQ